jgi:predicted PurR-regulated permease PerM
MFLLSIISTILFSIIGIEHSLLWGIIIGTTNVIPYIGPYIGGAIVVTFTLLTSYKKAFIVLIVIVILQLIESNFISPNIHSKTVKTSPILVLLFVSIFGQILGIFGMIIAVPILSIFQILVNKIPILKN